MKGNCLVSCEEVEDGIGEKKKKIEKGEDAEEEKKKVEEASMDGVKEVGT